ncbi:HET-domain-containing protein, partial [Cadophora sp. DSE1049]
MSIVDDDIYFPLDSSKAQTRLVLLQPGKTREIVRCELSVAALEEKPKYEALSYEWGDAKTTWAIVLNGKRKLIRENLYQALLHLRNQDTIRTLWIDALSINQCDIQERNQQVQEMHRIYSRASIVLIWLGLENDTTGPAFDLLKRGGVRNFRGSVLKMALADLCDRPYWNRVWIVQEVGLA